VQKKLSTAQIVVLLSGTLFAFYTVFIDFLRFYQYEGTFFKVKDCIYPNPVTTPCFYGAFAFLLALLWAYKIKDTVGSNDFLVKQKKLIYLLVVGTIFAWSNFGILYVKFLNTPAGEQFSCSGVPATSPFTTSCFVGSTVFLVSLILGIVLYRKVPAN